MNEDERSEKRNKDARRYYKENRKQCLRRVKRWRKLNPDKIKNYGNTVIYNKHKVQGKVQIRKRLNMEKEKEINAMQLAVFLDTESGNQGDIL